MTGQTVSLTSWNQRRIAHDLIDAAPAGAVVNVKKATRTLDQNALMWVLLSKISRAKPEGRLHTPEIWKALFMSACGHQVQFVNGLDGLPFPVGFRSSKLDKDQMGELLECIQEYAARHGVNLSDEAAA